MIGLRRVWRSLFPVVLLVLLSGCGDQAPRLKQGEPTPSFTLDDLNGGSIAFPSDLAGQVVAIRFWADWCPFCKGEMHDLEPVYRAYEDKGLRIFAVNVRQDRETAAAFVEPLGISYEVLLDRDGSVARAYGVTGLPTTFIVDRRGRLVARILGESTAEVFEQLIQGPM